MSFVIRSVPAGILAGVRASGLDARGTRAERIVADGGEPVRCCLRNAVAGEELILFGYEPAMPASPYREAGAVLAHASPCDGPAALDAYPPQWYGRPRSCARTTHVAGSTTRPGCTTAATRRR